MNRFNIAIGSTNEIEIHAVTEALELISISSFRLIGGATDSLVKNQPFGFEEIFKGALNRATSSLRLFKITERSKTIGIGIENGIIEMNELYFDIAIISVIVPGHPVFYAVSQGISIPFKYVEKSLQSSGNITVGSIIAGELNGNPADPHSTLTGGIVKRQDILVEALKSVFSQINTVINSN